MPIEIARGFAEEFLSGDDYSKQDTDNNKGKIQSFVINHSSVLESTPKNMFSVVKRGFIIALWSATSLLITAAAVDFEGTQNVLHGNVRSAIRNLPQNIQLFEEHPFTQLLSSTEESLIKVYQDVWEVPYNALRESLENSN